MQNQEDPVDKIASQWRQGDIIRDHQLLQDILAGLNIYAEKPAPIIGWILTSQTCDIVRSQRVQPFIQVCAIVKKDANGVVEAKKRKSPRFAYVPNLAPDSSVADLAVTTTLTKDRLAKTERVDGGFDHEDAAEDQSTWISRFQEALSRHKARFAFPDNFNALKKALGEQLKKAFKAKETEHLIIAVDEVRADVQIENNDVKGAHIWFLLDPAQSLSDEILLALDDEIKKIIEAVKHHLNGAVSYRVVSEEELTLRDYRKSHLVDFDDVS